MRFSLRDYSIEVVTHLGNKRIREISHFGDDRLLISETTSINRKNVARISWLDLETGRAQVLYPGVMARYIAAADSIVYDDGSRLFIVTQEEGAESAKQVLSHRRFQLSAMVEVANGLLLLETLEDGVPSIQAYRADDGTLTTLDALARTCRLKGAAWIGDLEQLACKERDAGPGGASSAYVFADLEGRVVSRPSLPEGEKFLALAYIEKQGALVLNESWRSQLDNQEKSAVWIHNVHSGENHQLSDTLDLGTSVVFSVY